MLNNEHCHECTQIKDNIKISIYNLQQYLKSKEEQSNAYHPST